MHNSINNLNPDATLKNWVSLYSDKLYTWALYKTSNKELAEDLVQETFLIAFQSLHKFEGKSEPKTWLTGILNNKIAEHFRKAYKNPVINESQKETHDNWLGNFFENTGGWKKEAQPKHWNIEQINLLDDTSFIAILQICLTKLPKNWNAAIQLKYLEEKKGELICQELGISQTNFWQILHRAKLQLRKCLELNWFRKQ